MEYPLRPPLHSRLVERTLSQAYPLTSCITSRVTSTSPLSTCYHSLTLTVSGGNVYLAAPSSLLGSRYFARLLSFTTRASASRHAGRFVRFTAQAIPQQFRKRLGLVRNVPKRTLVMLALTVKCMSCGAWSGCLSPIHMVVSISNPPRRVVGMMSIFCIVETVHILHGRQASL